MAFSGRLRAIALLVCVLLIIGLAVGLWYVLADGGHTLRVQTVLLVPRGTGRGEVSRVAIRIQFDNTAFQRSPNFIDEQGNFYIAGVDDFRVLVFSPEGSLRVQFDKRSADSRWDEYPIERLVGQPAAVIWVADMYKEEKDVSAWCRLRKYDWQGHQLAEFREPQPSAQGSRKEEPETSTDDETAPRLVDLGRVDELFIDRSGNLYTLDTDVSLLLRQFTPHGELAKRQEYTFTNPTGEWNNILFSIFVSSAGKIYNTDYARFGQNGFPEALQVTIREPSGAIRYRVIDLEAVPSVWRAMLVGVDGEDNLYLSLIERLPDDPEEYTYKRPWRDLTGVARVPADGRAEKVFDVYKHYHSFIEKEQARWQEGEVRPGLGQVIHVDTGGNLYLEMTTREGYRIDKIGVP